MLLYVSCLLFPRMSLGISCHYLMFTYLCTTYNWAVWFQVFNLKLSSTIMHLPAMSYCLHCKYIYICKYGWNKSLSLSHYLSCDNVKYRPKDKLCTLDWSQFEHYYKPFPLSIRSHTRPMCVPVHVESWPKLKPGQRSWGKLKGHITFYKNIASRTLPSCPQ